MLIFLLALLRPESRLQRHHVGTFHTRPYLGDKYDQGQRHQHVRQLHDHRRTGLPHFL